MGLLAMHVEILSLEVLQGESSSSWSCCCPGPHLCFCWFAVKAVLTHTKMYEQADPDLAFSTGYDFAPKPAEHEWTFTIEPVTGFTTTVSPSFPIWLWPSLLKSFVLTKPH